MGRSRHTLEAWSGVVQPPFPAFSGRADVHLPDTALGPQKNQASRIRAPLLRGVGRSIAFQASFVWRVHVKAQAETLKSIRVGHAGASPSRSAVASRWSVRAERLVTTDLGPRPALGVRTARGSWGPCPAHPGFPMQVGGEHPVDSDLDTVPQSSEERGLG